MEAIERDRESDTETLTENQPRIPRLIELDAADHKYKTIYDLGVPFRLPPSEDQQKVCDVISRCLITGQIGLIESPSGVHSSTAMFNSIIAWINVEREQNRDFSRKLIWITRDIAQTTKIQKTLKALPYKPRVITLVGRDLLCIHKPAYRVIRSLKSAVEQTLACHEARTATTSLRPCTYQICGSKAQYGSELSPNHVESVPPTINPRIPPPAVADIEDLRLHGRTQRTCPYYLQQHLLTPASPSAPPQDGHQAPPQSSSKPRRKTHRPTPRHDPSKYTSSNANNNIDVLLIPQTDLFDRSRMSALSAFLDRAVVVLDSAHTLESACTDVMDWQTDTADLRTVVDYLHTLDESDTDALNVSINEVRHVLAFVNLVLEYWKTRADGCHNSDNGPYSLIYPLFPRGRELLEQAKVAVATKPYRSSSLGRAQEKVRIESEHLTPKATIEKSFVDAALQELMDNNRPAVAKDDVHRTIELLRAIVLGLNSLSRKGFKLKMASKKILINRNLNRLGEWLSLIAFLYQHEFASTANQTNLEDMNYPDLSQVSFSVHISATQGKL